MWSMTQEKLVLSIYHLQIIKDVLLVYLAVAVNRKKWKVTKKTKNFNSQQHIHQKKGV